MLNSRLIMIGLFCYLSPAIAQDTVRLHSPSGKIQVKIWMGERLYYTINYADNVVLNKSAIDVIPAKHERLSSVKRIKSAGRREHRGTITSPVPEKRKIIPDNYNELTIACGVRYTINFRAYDDGVAYRVAASFRDSLEIQNEIAEFNFPGQPFAYFPEVRDRKDPDIFHTSFEHTYRFAAFDSLNTSSLTYNPLLVVPESGPKIAITESDLEEYPGMFLKASGNTLRAVFAGFPAEEVIAAGEFSQRQVKKRAPYIARTAGTRKFPWRIIIISEHDKDLPANDIVYRLASPSRIGAADWIEPGNITDEWIIDVNLFNVPFRAGRNTASYLYYIDFAQRFGIDRIMLDAGWSDNNNLFSVNPQINMDSLLAYAKSKGVRIALWTLALTLERQLDSALALFNRWGVDFIMTDFIDRDDQKAVRLHHRIAKACADHKIMVMFHGSYPPKGFNRTYPNAVTREAVLGSEYNIWSRDVSPEHDVLLPFTRMLAGSLDYEPGLLSNATARSFHPAEGYVMSPGTRCHQLAMYAVYDSPIQFFSGNPSQGLMEPEFMEFLGSVPTTWDETVIPLAKVGDYIVTARRKNDDWYIGGMTDWSARDLEIPLTFLGNGAFSAVICRDGTNADRYASDYVFEKKDIDRDDLLKIHLAPGGGFLIRLSKK